LGEHYPFFFQTAWDTALLTAILSSVRWVKKDMLNTRREITGKVSIVGHRGAPACAPENTLASFEEGLRQGADIIELDVQLSADGHVVVFHDERLERTTDGAGRLEACTLAELKALDAGSWFDASFAGVPIPTLDEVLAWAKNRTPLFIELKYSAPPVAALASGAVEQVRAYEMADQVMFISFAHPALSWVKQNAPELATGALYSARVSDPVRLVRETGADAVMPLWDAVTAEDVRKCHEAGLSVHTWGHGADYAALMAMGVDCVNADWPEQVRRDFF
jgi:glycerophosphoryl diester phosphodiesterase